MTTEYNILNKLKNNNNNKLNTRNNLINIFFTVDRNGFASEPLVRKTYRRRIFGNVKTPVNTWRCCVRKKKKWFDSIRAWFRFPVAFFFLSKNKQSQSIRPVRSALPRWAILRRHLRNGRPRNVIVIIAFVRAPSIAVTVRGGIKTVVITGCKRNPAVMPGLGLVERVNTPSPRTTGPAVQILIMRLLLLLLFSLGTRAIGVRADWLWKTDGKTSCTHYVQELLLSREVGR